MVDSGELGDLILLRGLNKGGRTAGTELMEIGTHNADSLRVFGGDAAWCFAYFTSEGRAAGVADIMRSKQMDPSDRDEGWVLGERAYTLYGLQECPVGEMYFFGSDSRDMRRAGMDILGTKGQLAVRRASPPYLWYLPQPVSFAADGNDRWQPVEVPLVHEDPYMIMVKELLRAIEEDTEHPSSGVAGRAALEMLMGAYESHRTGARVEFPLKAREHPLERWRREGG
jgi:predicted dehydrogenase